MASNGGNFAVSLRDMILWILFVRLRRFLLGETLKFCQCLGKAIGSFAIFPERVKRKFIDYAPSKWQTEFPIQYSFDGTHSKDTTIHWSKFESCSNIGRKQKQMIRLALTYWRNTTCLEFEERQDQPQTDRIVFTRNGGSCTSEVGKNYIFHTQLVYLPDLCFEVGILVHEISHALGFYHEQVRLDRDDYIKIHTENTHTNLGGSQSSFEKESIINSHQIPYDYGSLMHYKTLLPRDNLSEPALKAMSTRISLYQKTIGQRDQLSFYDVKLMNKVYCSDSCPVQPQCLHHGYANPRNCSHCLCPDGLMGIYCEKVMPGVGAPCGGNINLGPRDAIYISSPKYPEKYQRGQECSWLIQTRSPKQVVHLRIIGSKFQTYCDMDHLLCMDYVEIRNSSADLAGTGMRLCCDTNEFFNQSIYSDGRAMMVLLRSYYQSGYGFRAEVKSANRIESGHTRYKRQRFIRHL